MQLRETEKSGKISKESQHVSSECSQRSETQMYDAVLEDEFASRPARHHRLEESTSLGESVEDSSDDDVDDSMDEDSDGSSEIEGMST